ncbi:MAG: hypothetical protein JNN30_11920 [Rhodanobacteraceae bacterium]|nr:hypothetical protein [Rhodanobacteraceae bacterium]
MRNIDGQQVEGVNITPKNGKPGFLPLAVYVDQLNAAEKWLNLYGRSLRETESDFGVVAKLRPKLSPCTPTGPELIPIPRPPALDPGGLITAWIRPGDIYVFERLGRRGTLVTLRQNLSATRGRRVEVSYPLRGRRTISAARHL